MLVSELVQLSISVPTQAAEAVTNLLTEEVGGVEQRDSETLAKAEEAMTELLVWLPGSMVKSRVDKVSRLIESLKELGVEADPWSWKSVDVAPEDWEEAYKDHFDVTRLGRFVVVKPTWKEYDRRPTDRVVELDPGMAFGTGLHASTELMVLALERLRGSPPKKVLDIGAGTGILSLAAARLWPNCKVLAIDNDETAVEVCQQNVKQNGLAKHIKVKHASGHKVDGARDLVLANLTRELLTDLHPRMRGLLTDGGFLVISGVLESDAQKIAHLYSQDLRMEPRLSLGKDEWVAFVFRARS